MEDYAIVLPSRKRAAGAAEVFQTLPTAIVYVDEREADDYRAVIPEASLRFHRPTRNLPDVMNVMHDDFDEPCLVMFADDFRGVRILEHRRGLYSKLVKDPDIILDIVENGVQCAEDADVGAFGWFQTANPMHYAPFDPLSLAAPIFFTFGIRGAARHRKYDVRLPARHDTDFTCRCLLEDRIVWVDRRFFFDHGEVFGGKMGGNVDLIDMDTYMRETAIVKQKWGNYVTIDQPSRQAVGRNKRPSKDGYSLRVRRRSRIAHGDGGE